MAESSKKSGPGAEFGLGCFLIVFSGVFLIMNFIMAGNIDSDNCNISDSKNRQTKQCLTGLNIVCVMLLLYGFLGVSNFKMHLLDKSPTLLGIDNFFKWTMPLFGLVLLVLSIYLYTIINNLDCDEDTLTPIKSCSIGGMTMSSIFFIVSLILCYRYQRETDEEIIEKAKETSSKVFSISESKAVSITQIPEYDENIKILKKSIDLVDINTQIEYNDLIEKLELLKRHAKLRDYATQYYKNVIQPNLKNPDKQIDDINSLCITKNLGDIELNESDTKIMLKVIDSKLPGGTRFKDKLVDCENVKGLLPKEVKQKIEKQKVQDNEDNEHKLALKRLEIEKAEHQVAELREQTSLKLARMKAEADKSKAEARRLEAEAVKSEAEANSSERLVKPQINPVKQERNSTQIDSNIGLSDMYHYDMPSLERVDSRFRRHKNKKRN